MAKILLTHLYFSQDRHFVKMSQICPSKITGNLYLDISLDNVFLLIFEVLGNGKPFSFKNL